MNINNIVIALGITVAAFVIVFVIYAGTTAKIIESQEKEIKRLKAHNTEIVKAYRRATEK